MRNRGRIYWKWIGTGPYETEVLIVLGGSTSTATEIFREDLDKRGFELPPCPEDFASDEMTYGRFIRYHDLRDCAIWLPDIPTTVQEIGTVAHESVHVVNHILTRCGVEFTVDGPPGLESPNDETWAYFTGYLVRSIMGFAEEVQADIKSKKKATAPKKNAASK